MLGILKRDQLTAAMAVCDAAFAPSTFESRLLDKAYNSDDDAPCYVWLEAGQIVACILYTLAYRGSEEIGYHIAPVAVHPRWQGRGIGTQLIGKTLASEPMADRPVFVLGDTVFYERFGFRPVKTAQCPYDPGNAHFRALRWPDEGDAFPIGYSNAFVNMD